MGVALDLRHDSLGQVAGVFILRMLSSHDFALIQHALQVPQRAQRVTGQVGRHA